MKKLLLLLIFSASFFASAQITELTYDTASNTLNVDQVPYELFGEPDLLWGDVVRRHHSDRLFTPRQIVQNDRTFTIAIDQYTLQPRQYFVNYSIEGQSGFNLETTPPTVYGVTTIEMPELTATFTVTGTGVYEIWYSWNAIDRSSGFSGTATFTVE